jgi:hypothetical protein
VTEVKPPAVVVIGDVVGSRRAVDRAALHRRLTGAIAEVNAELGGDLRMTVGDEYQGAFPTLGHALRATLRLRLALLPDADVRHGIGLGPVETLDAGTRIEDGPGWWAARDAIGAAANAQRHAATRSARTAYRRGDGVPGPEPALVDAALLGRDELVTRLSGRGLSVLRGLMAGRTQRDIAEAEGISTSAVSQRVRHDGLGILLAVDERMGDIG